MKQNYLYILLGVLGFFFVQSCSNDDPDQSNSIFNEEVKRSSFDKWLDANYVQPYNIRIDYLLKDVETDFSYNVIPADLKKSKQMAILLKHLWLEAYTEVAGEGVHFIRATAPKHFHFIGSAEHDPKQGTIRLGVAEGGKKITITQINTLDPNQFDQQNFFNTVHHEFAHILHQTINYSTEFQKISAADYAPTTWNNRKMEVAAELGFVSPYAGAQHHEDFAETLARYLTRSDEQWNEVLEMAGEEGRAKINKKWELVRAYMKTSWGVDIVELQKVVRRRANEVQYMNLDKIDF